MGPSVCQENTKIDKCLGNVAPSTRAELESSEDIFPPPRVTGSPALVTSYYCLITDRQHEVQEMDLIAPIPRGLELLGLQLKEWNATEPKYPLTGT